MNRGGRILDDETDFADRLRHRLTDQVEASQLFDPRSPRGDLVEAQDEAEQPARVDQAQQDDIARIRDLVGQDQLAQPRPDLALLGVVYDRVPPGMEDPEKPALLLAQHAFFYEPFQRDVAIPAGVQCNLIDRGSGRKADPLDRGAG